MNEPLIEKYKQLVAHFGTQQSAALALHKAQSTINGYLSGDHQMGAITAIQAEKITRGKFKAVDLCPALKQAEVAHV